MVMAAAAAEEQTAGLDALLGAALAGEQTAGVDVVMGAAAAEYEAAGPDVLPLVVIERPQPLATKDPEQSGCTESRLDREFHEISVGAYELNGRNVLVLNSKD